VQHTFATALKFRFPDSEAACWYTATLAVKGLTSPPTWAVIRVVLPNGDVLAKVKLNSAFT
jgi:hypothetical protein